MNNTVHAEIEYFNKTKNHWVHSDICPPGCSSNGIDEEYKKYLHDCLEEWLTTSNGTGGFYIKQEGFSGLGIEEAS